MSRYLIAVGLILVMPSPGKAQGLDLPLPRNPECSSWSQRISAVDKTGCTAISKNKYARGAENTPDSSVLQKYKHNQIKYLTYHHSWLPHVCKDRNRQNCTGRDVDLVATRAFLDRRANSKGIGEQVKNIQKYHIKKAGTPMFRRGGPDVKWGDIAYHFVVDRFGNIVEGREIRYKPASGTIYGTGGRNTLFRYRTGTAGHFTVVILGNYDYEELTEYGLRGIVRVLSAGQRKFRVPTKNIGAHKDHAATSCPGENIYKLRDDIKKMTIAYSVQAELDARRCDPGKLDGYFGTNSKRALKKMKSKHPSLGLTGANDDTLWKLLKNPGKEC